MKRAGIWAWTAAKTLLFLGNIAPAAGRLEYLAAAFTESLRLPLAANLRPWDYRSGYRRLAESVQGRISVKTAGHHQRQPGAHDRIIF